MTHAHARYARLIAQNLGGVVLEQNLDVGGVLHALLHSLRRTQIGLANDQIDLTAQTCQVGCLLARGVAATDNSHVLLAVEEAVAGSARADAHTLEALLRGQTEILRGCTCADDNALSLNLLVAVDGDHEGACAQLRLGHRAETDIGTETLGLSAHTAHQLVAVDTLGVRGEVLDFGGCGELTAGGDTLVEYGVKTCTCGIDCSGVARRTTTDNKAFNLFHSCIFFRYLCSIAYHLCRPRRATYGGDRQV